MDSAPSSQELYAALHTGTPGDVEFYRRACSGAGSVLELGCGAGRMLCEFAADIDRVVGLEAEPGMLALATARLKASGARATTELGDMQQFELAERFDRVVIPFNGLFCVRGMNAKLQCLRCIKRHLTPSGQLLFDFYDTSPLDEQAAEVRAEPEEDDFEPLSQLSCGGMDFTVLEKNLWWPSRKELEVVYRFCSRVNEVQHARILHSYCSVDELEGLLRDAGFTHVSAGELSPESGSQLWLSALAD